MDPTEKFSDLLDALDDYVCAIIQREAAHARTDDYGPSKAVYRDVRVTAEALSEAIELAEVLAASAVEK